MDSGDKPPPPGGGNAVPLQTHPPVAAAESTSSTDISTHPDGPASAVSPLAETPGAPTSSSWSSSSDQQLGHGFQENSDPADRVFPIRSVLSVDSSSRAPGERREYFPHSGPESFPLPSRSEAWTGLDLSGGQAAVSSSGSASITSPIYRGPARPRKSTLDSAYPPTSGARVSDLAVFSADAELDDDAASQADTAGGSLGADTANSETQSPRDSKDESFMTVRFRHMMTEGEHFVITGREGTLQRCEDEPIHAPGAIQSFGLFIGLRESDDAKLQVRYVSENSRRIIGYTPQQLFGLRNFLDIFTDEQADNLMDHIDFVRDDEIDSDPAVKSPEVFSVSIRVGHGKTIKLWCALHINSARPDILVCEFELDDDEANPLRPPGEETPENPQDTLNSNPTADELLESTEVLSRPLRVLRSARKRRGEAGAMQVFDILSQVQEQLAMAPTLERFLKILVGIVKELVGFHRVMVYQFDSSFNGKVVTELVDTQQTRDLYKGLHFPASDIPKQARELYKINKVRLLYDRDQETARLVCRTLEDLEQPLDLTHSYLRAMSPIHLKYLGNMAVRSSMSISINAFGELWGLIACHSYGAHGMRVSFPIRKMCRLVGETASRNIERLSYASRLQARKLINTVPTEKNPSGYIIASSDDLLRLFDADFGTLSIHGETKILGKVEQSQEALFMLEYLRVRKLTSVYTTQDIAADLPDLRYPPGFRVIAGCLYVPLSAGGNDFIVFYREGQVREVKWAGNPYEKVVREGTTAYLEPRQSFRVWHETVLGKCREWTEEQVETAAVLCLVYGKFIEVWRQKEAALQNSKLTRLLLANQAHEVRTPLNAIINYLEIAMEGSLDQETRDNLVRSHSASKSLIYVINDLLDLTKAEEGQDLVKDEAFDLLACIREATEPFHTDASRKGLKYEIIERPGLPRFVYGDQRRVRTAMSNLTSNAFQYTTEGCVKVEVYIVEIEERFVRVEFAVQDTGQGMDDGQVEAIFRDLEQVTEDDPEAADIKPTSAAVPESSSKSISGESASKQTLGLGLAVVSRIVRNMDGQLRVKSALGQGSRFVMQLRFHLPPQDPTEQPAALLDTVPDSSVAAVSDTSMAETILPADGEVTLVDSGGATTTVAAAPGTIAGGPVGRSDTSLDDVSIASRRSSRSSQSTVDRLIEAIRLPLVIGEPESSVIGLSRKNSLGLYYNQQQGAGDNIPGSNAARSMSPGANNQTTRRASDPALGDGGDGDATTGATSVAQFVTDSHTPLRPVKKSDDEEYRSLTEIPQPLRSGSVLFEITTDAPQPSPGAKTPQTQHHTPAEKASEPELESEEEKEQQQQQQQGTTQAAKTALEASSEVMAPGPQEDPSEGLNVLCAEDDPVNMKLLRKRLEKANHKVKHTVNGEDCAMAYKNGPKSFDVVLMDMQMPIMDGLGSARMIREFEASPAHIPSDLSDAAAKVGRIPIFAVSASLLEKERDVYVRGGFDGWILKPIDFKRLSTLLDGIQDGVVRRACFYRPGHWERGGWFASSPTSLDDTLYQHQHRPDHLPLSPAAAPAAPATPAATTVRSSPSSGGVDFGG